MQPFYCLVTIQWVSTSPLQFLSVPGRRKERLKSINWRETIIALEHVEAFIRKHCDEMKRRRFLFVIAEDFSKERSQHFVLHQVSGDLWSFSQPFEFLGGSRIPAIYYPTALQPADEPSRRKPVIPKKCFDYIAYLESKIGRKSQQES